MATSSNTTRLAASPLARNEVFQDARQATTLTQVQNIADATLRAGKGLVIFSSKIIETTNTRYGIDYGLGAIVPCQFLNELVDCRLDKVHVSVVGGRETIDVDLQSLV